MVFVLCGSEEYVWVAVRSYVREGAGGDADGVNDVFCPAWVYDSVRTNFRTSSFLQLTIQQMKQRDTAYQTVLTSGGCHISTYTHALRQTVRRG